MAQRATFGDSLIQRANKHGFQRVPNPTTMSLSAATLAWICGALAVCARDNGARRFVVAGGESSGAVTQALGVDRLDIGAEIAPGVPWCYCDTDGARIALTLKSGNFGTETFFADALSKLETT